MTNDRLLFAVLLKYLQKRHSVQVKYPFNENEICWKFSQTALFSCFMFLAIQKLKEWMKPEVVRPDLTNMTNKCQIKSEPYGIALIMGAWNYPVQLVLLPLVGAISAGLYFHSFLYSTSTQLDHFWYVLSFLTVDQLPF